jgi:F pilus assembly Type-IV secretion system for plasmid transfer.
MLDKTNKKKQPVSKEEIVQQQREKTANQWVPVADIDGNIVYKKDNTLVGMLRVQPLNLDLLSDKEKRRKVEALAEELNGENEGLQIFCIGRPVDLNNYLEWLQEKTKQEQDYTRKRLLKSFIKEASNTASNGETVERRFYIIISKKADNKAEEELTGRLRDLQHKLSSAELISNICKDDELMDVYSLFAHPVQASFERATIEMELAPILDI